MRAGVVDLPDDWPWSSYRAMTGVIATPPFLDCRRLLDILAPDDPSAGVARFREGVLTADIEAQRLPASAILGDDDFIANFKARRAQVGREVPRREGRPSLEAIFRDAVTRTARDRAILAAFRERFAMTEIARYLELHPSTVSRIVSGCQSVTEPCFQDLTPVSIRPDPNSDTNPDIVSAT